LVVLVVAVVLVEVVGSCNQLIS